MGKNNTKIGKFTTNKRKKTNNKSNKTTNKTSNIADQRNHREEFILEAQAGDSVKIYFKDDSKPKDNSISANRSNIKTGILMPRPKLLGKLGKDIVVLKINNGYNIGIDKSKIDRIEVVKKYSVKKTANGLSNKSLKKNKLPKISLISLGGTISSKIDYRTGGTRADYTASDFVRMFPEISKIAKISVKTVMSKMSESMGTEDYPEIAKAIYEELKTSDGVVVTCGTDTLHYISAAMSFAIDPGKPVIFTASQRSIDRGSSDAFMNVISAIAAALVLDYSGVGVCMHASSSDDVCLVSRGTKVRKMHTSRRDAFRPINELPLAKVFYEKVSLGNADEGVIVVNDDFDRRHDNPVLNSSFGKAALINIYPGIDKNIIDYHVDKGYKGIVLAGTALGHVPEDESKHNLIPGIKRAIKKGIVVAIATQTIYGSTHPFVYSNLRKLSIGCDAVFLGDMLAETAWAKMSWAVANIKGYDSQKDFMKKNIAGEIKQRSDYRSFLY